MSRADHLCLIFGIIAGVTFIAFPALLGALLPHYDPIAQTISEIGKTGSPFEATFRLFSFVGVICLVLFSYGVYRFSSYRHLSFLPALLLGFTPR